MSDSTWIFDRRHVLFGFLAGLGLHGLQVPLFFLLQGSALVFVGASQLLYVIPALVFAAREKRKDWVCGLLIAAGVTFLVNAVCFGLVVASL